MSQQITQCLKDKAKCEVPKAPEQIRELNPHVPALPDEPQPQTRADLPLPDNVEAKLFETGPSRLVLNGDSHVRLADQPGFNLKLQTSVRDSRANWQRLPEE